MRGIYAVRSQNDFAQIHDELDSQLDEVIERASHLLLPEANALHFLRAIRFRRTEVRGRFVRRTYDQTPSQSVRRACIDCWYHWGDRASFNRLRNQWPNLGPDAQRMFWLAAGSFGEEGEYARGQLRKTLGQTWRLGFEEDGDVTFSSLYYNWAQNGDR